MSIRSVLEWLGMREFLYNHVSLGSVVGRRDKFMHFFELVRIWVLLGSGYTGVQIERRRDHLRRLLPKFCA